MSQLRIALTLPGEASLGAFQAGAVSALIVAIQDMNRRGSSPVRLDAMTGTSSGSLTAVLASHALLTGRDPVEPLRRAWVLEPTVDALRGRDGRAPLTLDRARSVAIELLFPRRDDSVPARRQAEKITVNFAMTSLRGFTYDVTQVKLPISSEDGDEIELEQTRATSHLDWAEHELGLDDDTDWLDVVDTAIASASHPAAFPPTLLDRSGKERAYAENGVDDFPDCSDLWYVDGGLLDREPVGRCIKVARGLDGDGSDHPRVILLLRPEPDVGFSSEDPAWTDEDDPPSWTGTLARALRIVVTHSLYEDLRRVERVNSRIMWRQRVAEELAPLLREGAEEKLQELIAQIRAEKAELRAGSGGEEAELATSVEDLLDQVLAEATGLAGKQRIELDVVSAPSVADVAGGSLLNFGGFLGEHLRANDFLVGYSAMVNWMGSRGKGSFDDEAHDAANKRIATIPGWIGGVRGRRPMPWRTRADVLRIAGRAARIGLRRRAPARRV